MSKPPDAPSGLESKQQESERERRIRLGEMTPFGNVLGNQLTSTGRYNCNHFMYFCSTVWILCTHVLHWHCNRHIS